MHVFGDGDDITATIINPRGVSPCLLLRCEPVGVSQTVFSIGPPRRDAPQLLWMYGVRAAAVVRSVWVCHFESLSSGTD